MFVLNDQSGTPWQNYHFLVCMFNRLKAEGHIVEIDNSPFNYGVSRMRQYLADKSIKRGYEFILRLDDDVILKPDYIEKLMKVIDQGFDLATGATPFIGQSHFKRESRFIQPVGNMIIFDQQGNYIFNGDDFGIEYYDESILPVHHFRSCALYKSKFHQRGVNYTPTRLSKHGFREEQLFSYKAILAGFKLGCNTKAIAYHLLTPSGGERFANSDELIKLNQEVLENETKYLFETHGNFIEDYNKRMGIQIPNLTQEDLLKETNLAKLK